MAVEGLRRGEIPSPDDRTPSPRIKYVRHLSDSELSPVDTPRKNKRKLNEPKRRTTDFSIKRFCPDSPGSACSESGRSEESTPEQVRNETPESPAADDIYSGANEHGVHPHFRQPFMIPDLRHHPYFIPQFYYNRLPGLPSGEGIVPMGMNGINRAPKMNPLKVPSVPHGNGLKIPTVPQHYDNGLNVPTSSKSNNGLKLPTVPHVGNGLKIPDLNALHSQSNTMSQSQQHSQRDSRISPSESQNVSPRSSRGVDNESPESARDRKSRKNYKNMTRERRVEANARERSRVHTISAAFEGLRRAVPSYSYNQKLSKLAILRIACTYISALTKLADVEESPSLKNTSFAECVDNCTRTIQTEGKARRRH